jgi:flagellar biosynthesis protein FlhG
VIIDLGAGIDETVMRFASVADEVIVVLTPDPTALTDAYAFIKLHAHHLSHRLQTGHPPALVVNQAGNDNEARAIAQALNNACRGFLHMTLDYLGSVRRDAKVVDAIRRQQPLLALHPKSHAASDVTTIAQRLIQRQRGVPAAAASIR